MARSVSLTRVTQRVFNRGFQQTLTAVGTDMASEMFVMRQVPENPLVSAGAKIAVFSRVASTADFYQLPISAPNTGETSYRVSSFVKPYDTAAEAATAWERIQDDVTALVHALDATDNLATPETVTVP